MRKRTRGLISRLTFGARAVGSTLSPRGASARRNRAGGRVRPGMDVTFRAELMPGRAPLERTFHVRKLLPNGRVLLDGISGEHTVNAFELPR
jgi:hypothetical protein